MRSMGHTFNHQDPSKQQTIISGWTRLYNLKHNLTSPRWQLGKDFLSHRWMTISLLTLEVERDCNDFYRWCLGAFHYRGWAAVKHSCRKVRVRNRYGILHFSALIKSSGGLCAINMTFFTTKETMDLGNQYNSNMFVFTWVWDSA